MSFFGRWSFGGGGLIFENLCGVFFNRGFCLVFFVFLEGFRGFLKNKGWLEEFLEIVLI